MNADRMRKIQELFAAALERPPGERAAFLRSAVDDDERLRAEVESLLEHDRSAGDGFMKVSAPRLRSHVTKATDDVAAAPATDAKPPAVPEIAGYEITRELGRGGQGVVYQAVQKTTKRPVAIKVLIEGLYASAAAQRRFEREIELVAQLRHPNIISIFHSDTTPDGRPYYVMDYVSGLPLTEYVQSKNLPLEPALELFLTVCEAVRYAHQKGVIHRDLKPTNIVVDEQGAPHVLDFGLAKPLRGMPDSLISIEREIIGTLAYMSPEQADGTHEMDTRADVYSLGVILYEILCGRRPCPTDGSIAEVLREIAESPPIPPRRNWSAETGVTRRGRRAGECPIDGDLETVMLKALAKERERRYQTAGDLARDLRHYLRGEPIEARGDSLGYVLWKQSRRLFRQAPVVTLALLCAILAPGLLTALVFWRQAVRDRDVANAAIGFLDNDVFQTLDPEKVGRDVDLREVLDAASARIGERFSDAPLAEASIRNTLGNLYCSLGENAKALAHLEQALRLRRAALGEKHLAVAESLVNVSRVLENLGRDREAEADLRAALEIRAELLGRDHPAVAASVEQLAAFARRQGNLELEALLEPGAPATARAAGNAAPPTTEPATREADLRERLEQARRQYGESHPEVAQRLTTLAEFLADAGNAVEAESNYEKALTIWTGQLGSEHIRVRELFAKLEELLVREGATAKLESLLSDRLDAALGSSGNPLALSSASWDVVKRTGYTPELYSRALEAATRAAKQQPDNGAFLNTLGVAQYRVGLFEKAWTTLLRSDKLNDDHPADIAFLAMSAARIGKTDDARHELDRLRELMRQRPWAIDPQSSRFLHEAETLIEGNSGG